MTTINCINLWLEQYKDFAAQLEYIAETKDYLQFDEFIEELSVYFNRHFPLYEEDSYGQECFLLSKYGFPMWVVVQFDENGLIELSKTVRCWFSSNDDIYCTVAELRDPKYRAELKRKYDKYVKQRVFAVKEYDYKAQVTVFTEYHENPQDAYKSGLIKLGNYSRIPYQYTLISLMNMPKENPYDEHSDDGFEYYTFGAKTEGEMAMAMIKADDVHHINKSLLVDTTNINHENRKDTQFITIMSVTEINKKGVLSYGIERFESDIEARQEAENIIGEWLFQNKYKFSLN